RVFPLNQGWSTTFSLLRPLQVDFSLVLHRPIESTAVIGQLRGKISVGFVVTSLAYLFPRYFFRSLLPSRRAIICLPHHSRYLALPAGGHHEWQSSHHPHHHRNSGGFGFDCTLRDSREP